MTAEATMELPYKLSDEPRVDKRRTDRSGTYDIKNLWQRSHEIIGMALLGHKNTEIAEILNITPATVSNTLNGSLGKEKLGGMREDRDEEFKKVEKRITELTKKALAVYDEILSAEGNPEVSLKFKKETADTVAMELAGHRAPTRIDTRSVHMTATAGEIEEFKKRGIIAAKESGMLIDATPEAQHDPTSETV